MGLNTWAMAIIGLAMVAGVAPAQDQRSVPSQRVQNPVGRVTVPLRQPTTIELQAEIASLSEQVAALAGELRALRQSEETQTRLMTRLAEREGSRFWALAHYSFNGCVASWRSVPMLNMTLEQAAANCRSDLATPVPHITYSEQ